MLKDRVDAAIAQVPDSVKANVFTAYRWAKRRLMEREGKGHYIQIMRDRKGIVCCFAKPEWNADHCGRHRPTGAEAIVQAVIGYEEGE